MKYRAVFSLRLRHLFYADNRCRDFQIEPAVFTQRLLKNYRCVLKPLPDRILVLTATGENDEPLIPIIGNVTFAFQLRLLNPDFSLFTELSDITSKATPLFTNAGSTPPAAEVALHLRERTARRGRGVFADVEIHSNDSMSKPDAGASGFFIQFQAKEGKWRYYLVTNRKSPSFAIESDRKFATFTPDASDPLAEALRPQYPGFSLVCFESTDPVRCQEAAIRQIRLKLGNDVIFENLPNPSFRSICAVQKDYAFYHVVKDIGVPVT